MRLFDKEVTLQYAANTSERLGFYVFTMFGFDYFGMLRTS